jgi:hypothetical protein
LLDAGYVVSSRMEVYRGSTLALVVDNIGVAAGLEVNGELIAGKNRKKQFGQWAI